MRLGCLVHDPARAALLPTVRYGAMLPPPSLPAAAWQPSPYDNNTNPTCVPIALAHAARAWSMRFGGDDVAIPLAPVDSLYCRATGVPLAQIAASDGADPLAVVEVAQTRGWDIGGQVPLVPDFAVLATDRMALAAGMAQCGAVMLALTLYQGDMDGFSAGRPWTAAPAGPVAGGHMVAAAAYDGLADDARVQVATWGAWQAASWSWIAPRLRLALVTGWRQLLGPDGDDAARWVAEESLVGP